MSPTEVGIEIARVLPDVVRMIQAARNAGRDVGATFSDLAAQVESNLASAEQAERDALAKIGRRWPT